MESFSVISDWPARSKMVLKGVKMVLKGIKMILKGVKMVLKGANSMVNSLLD